MPKAIKQTYLIESPAEEVWKALTNEEYIQDWGGSPVKMDDKVGTEFEFWGGEIWGKNIEAVPNEKLVQEWYGGNWDKPSLVTFYLFKEDGKTRLELVHESLPEKEYDNFEDGWKEYYLGPLQEMLENKI